jgi:hypothetical protein
MLRPATETIEAPAMHCPDNAAVRQTEGAISNACIKPSDGEGLLLNACDECQFLRIYVETAYH